MGELCEGNTGRPGLFRLESKTLVWNEHAHAFKPNQMPSATMQATTKHHTSGVTCFELPLRGESLAA